MKKTTGPWIAGGRKHTGGVFLRGEDPPLSQGKHGKSCCWEEKTENILFTSGGTRLSEMEENRKCREDGFREKGRQTGVQARDQRTTTRAGGGVSRGRCAAVLSVSQIIPPAIDSRFTGTI